MEKPVWVTAPWTGKVNENKAGDQFGGTPVPGITIAQANGESSPSRCTLGAAVRTAEGAPAFITAGHCDERPGNQLWLYPSADISGVDTVHLPKPYTDVTDTDGKPDPDTGVVNDSALVPLSGLNPAATVIASRYRIAGMLTATAAKELAPKTPICFDGAVSGVRCGVVTGDTGGVLGFSREPGAPAPFISPGDSGAPVFVLDSQGRAALVGLLSERVGEGIGWASYLDSALSKMNAAVFLDSKVAPFKGVDFSRRTVG
ncbi:hypothetical protein BST13_30500 [Mycobacterium aquaticum]|uniref:Peptidase S1 domain-containing protein n=2 Tax=Mycobacterium aquaticum TaxID=1927124 RepID=A0A1X0ABE7_9MYCO|nr:hypothetical protein BST13_30500 [Mycobacterium aquaticum]